MSEGVELTTDRNHGRKRPGPILQIICTLLVPLMVWVLVGCGSGAGGTAGSDATEQLQISLITEPDPPRTGPVTLIVEVRDGQGGPVDGAQVSVEVDHVGMAHGGIKGQLAAQGSGQYRATGSLSMPGIWRAVVQVDRPGKPTQTRTFDLQVR
jgi:hypothetical protein